MCLHHLHLFHQFTPTALLHALSVKGAAAQHGGLCRWDRTGPRERSRGSGGIAERSQVFLVSSPAQHVVPNDMHPKLPTRLYIGVLLESVGNEQ